MLSIEQLQTPPTRSEVTDWLITTLGELGFSTTGWQQGRVQNTLLNAVASTVAGAGQLAAVLVNAGFNSTAVGTALTLYSESRYSNTRTPGTQAQGDMTFTSTATVPYAVVAGQLIITDDLGTEFGNTEAATIPAGGSVDIDVQALLIGTDGNIGNNSTLSLKTPLAGVTVTNPGPGDVDGDGFADPWHDIVTGTDQESDAELQTRNSSKWGTLSVVKTSTAVENLALNQDGVEKALVNATNPRGPNTVDVYVSAATALTSTAEITAAQAAFALATFGTDDSWPAGDVGGYPSVYSLFHPSTSELVVEGVVYYDGQYTQADVEADLSDRLTALVSTVPIGGKNYSTSVTNTITLGDILQVIEGTRGVVSVTLSSPTGNVAVGTTTLIVPPSDWITGRISFEVAA